MKKMKIATADRRPGNLKDSVAVFENLRLRDINCAVLVNSILV